jgi:pimeloyl-ACP methyl ester carboxylesterase
MLRRQPARTICKRSTLTTVSLHRAAGRRASAGSEAQRQQALQWCKDAGKEAVLACIIGWGGTDFRADLKRVSLPALVLHGDSDASVPFGGSAKRTHDAVPGSELCVIAGGYDQQLTFRMFRCARRRGSHVGQPIMALEGSFGA